MKLSPWMIVIASFLLVTAPGLAQEDAAAEPPAMPQPTEEHEVLEMFVGEWTGSGTMEPGPYGPGGPVEWTESCSWLGDAGFHVVCRSEGTGPTGPMTGLGVMGYDPAKEVYTHYGVDSTGWSGSSEGTRDGDTWTFRSTETIGGETFHSRFTMTMESPSRFTFAWSMSEDGETWKDMMTGVTEKE